MATMTGFLGSQAVLGAFGLVQGAAGYLADQLQEGAEEAIVEEQALARLSQSLALTGNYSKEAANDLNDFAGEMEGLAGVGQDVILSNLAALS